MKKLSLAEEKDRLFSMAETGRILGISRNTVIREINKKKLGFCIRGDRRKCSWEHIDEYKKKQERGIVDSVDIDFNDYPGVDKIEGVTPIG